jgi:alcohol dehydrogenase
VEACGICHSDSMFVDDQWPGLQFPVTPGHEIAGHIDALGDGVAVWREGDRVAIGWSGGYCGHCRSCRRGKIMHCEAGMVTGANVSRVSRRIRPLRGGARERAGPPSRRTISY